MKRYLYIVLLVVFCVFSWFFVIHDYKTGESEYLRLMKEAEISFEKKIYDDAEEKYKKALQRKPRDEKAQFGLAKTYFSLEKYDEAALICEKALEANPKNQEITIFEAKCLMSGGKYAKSVDILSKVEQNKQIQEMMRDAKSKYSLKYFKVKFPKNWDVCAPLAPHLAVLTENESMVAYNARGKLVVRGNLSYLGPASEDGELYPAINDGTWCYVDKLGKRKIVPDEEYEFLGPFCCGFAVVKKDGKFGYIDMELNEHNIKYENAYNFSDNRAVIKEDEKISIIDTDFSVVKGTDYTAIVADEYGYTNHFGTSVFIKDGMAYLCNDMAENTTNFSADFIGLPASKESLVEFRQGEKYGFVKVEDGEVIIEPKFDDAKCFSLGLAPVKVEGKWGYIDEKGSVIVKPSFTFAGLISKEGTAFVQNEAGYALITFYHLSK